MRAGRKSDIGSWDPGGHGAKEVPKPSQEGSKEHQLEPRDAKGSPRIAKQSQKGAKGSPRAIQRGPIGAQEVPKGTLGAALGTPKVSQERLREPKPQFDTKNL